MRILGVFMLIRRNPRSGPVQPRDILVRTEKALAALNSFQADFEQSFFSTTVSTPLREKGRLFYQKPGRMRWDYEGRTSGQIVVLKDGVLETYDPEENQLHRQKLPKEQTDTAIFGLLSGQARLSETYRGRKQPLSGSGRARSPAEIDP